MISADECRVRAFSGLGREILRRGEESLASPASVSDHGLVMPSPHRFRALLCGMVALLVLLQPLRAIEAITFNAEPGKLFLPVDEAVKELGWEFARDQRGNLIRLNETPVRAGSLRRLTDGTELVSTGELAQAGATVSEPNLEGVVRVGGRLRGFTLVMSPQFVEISLAKQRLYAWQGDRLVLETHISSGRNNRTPAGEFRAGPFRSAMHYSKLYDNAPMPWSVQIHGNIFIHGFKSVPDRPASHGCIRMPLTDGNPARFFYEWVLSGTPVSVKKD